MVNAENGEKCRYFFTTILFILSPQNKALDLCMNINMLK